MHTVEELKSLKPHTKFFVGIDSDGCLFDTMEIKHKECFCPQFINHFDLQPVSKYARETWDFVNLYSKTRGCNRFVAVTTALDLVASRREVQARGAKAPLLAGLREWVARETRLGNPALQEEVERTHHPDLQRALEWSLDVNAAVKRIVRNVPPFPLVRESLARLAGRADVVVVSQTPTEALVRELHEHGLDTAVRLIAGQELGTKTQHIAFGAGSKYAPGHVLMIGDAEGDLVAARANNALFYPINPGAEEAAWERFHGEALERFLAGTYAGDYERSLVEQFQRCLPELAPWQHQKGPR
jgi:phosphoglycolate phosphatase-like HAD superfamily hydrolase